MGMWTLEIPGWHPVPINKLLGHPMAAARLKAHDRDIVAKACLVYGVPPATGRRLVRLHLVLNKGQRACDPDAYHKSLLDALVGCGALKNDSMHWVLCPPATFSRSDRTLAFLTLQDA